MILFIKYSKIYLKWLKIAQTPVTR